MPAFSRLGPYPSRRARPARLPAPRALRVRRPRRVPPPDTAVSAVPLAHGRARARQVPPGQGDCAVRRRRARGGRGAGPDRGVRAHRSRPPRQAYGSAWSWNDGKQVMGGLLLAGESRSPAVAASSSSTTSRNASSHRRCSPAPVPDPDDAKRELIVFAAPAMGVSTAKDLADYFHLGGYLDRGADPKVTRVPALLADLVDDGRLVPMTRRGLARPGLHRPGTGACRSSSTRGRSFSPFDSLIWERHRAGGSSGSTTASRSTSRSRKRVHGYYVLPFLLGDTFVGAGRPQGRPQGRRARGADRLRRAGAQTQGSRRCARGRARRDGLVARSRAHRGAGSRRPRRHPPQGPSGPTPLKGSR